MVRQLGFIRHTFSCCPSFVRYDYVFRIFAVAFILIIQLMTSLPAQAAPFNLDRSSIAASGGSSQGGNFSLKASHIKSGTSGISNGGGFRILAGYIYTLNRGDRDSDTIADLTDNCPTLGNTGQQNLDMDAFGDVCDADVDGDSILNGADPDDDNDGMHDSFEISFGLNPYSPTDAGLDPDNDGLTSLEEFELNPNLNPNDPDTDGDGIDDGLDSDPIMTNNTCVGADPTFIDDVSSDIQCAASNSIIVELTLPDSVQTSGHLRLIAPMVIFKPGFKVQGQLNVRSTHPCAACGP